MIGFFKILELWGYPVKEARNAYQSFKQTNDLPTWQQEKCKQILNFHYENNKFYREFIGEKPACWDDVPVMTKSILKGDWKTKIPNGEKFRRK